MSCASVASWYFAVLSFVLCDLHDHNPLESRLSELTLLAQKNSLIQLDYSSFHKFVFFPQRNYSALILFTVSSSDCLYCQQLREEFEVLAHSWHESANNDNSLFIGQVTYDQKGLTLLKQFKLGSIPIILFFEKVSSRPHKLPIMGDALADRLAKILYAFTSLKFEIKRPINWIYVLCLSLPICLLAWMAYRDWELLYLSFPRLIGTMSICFIDLVVSGHVINCIRGTELYGRKGMKLVHHSKRQQYLVETPIIFLLITTMVYGMLVLENPDSVSFSKKKAVVMLSVIVMVLAFSVVLGMARLKVNYPFSWMF